MISFLNLPVSAFYVGVLPPEIRIVHPRPGGELVNVPSSEFVVAISDDQSFHSVTLVIDDSFQIAISNLTEPVAVVNLGWGSSEHNDKR